ncbi:MAG: hypothetical protein IPK26_23770 [Planctomycetes bacterium]|nr:hypothetical protein [Planctomycetota bacterium]
MTSKKLLATSVALLFSTAAFAQGDECTGALAVGIGANGPFTNVGSTTSFVWPCAAGGNDVWFSYIGGYTGPLTLSLCGADYDTAVEVFDGTGGCGALLSVGCNDDFCGLQSTLTVNVTGGTQYFIRVGGFNSRTGNFPLDISIPGDECATAAAVVNGVNGPFSNVGYSTSAPAWPCGGGGTDRWFTYQATCTGNVTVDTCSANTNFDTTIEVFDVCGGVSLGCNDDSCGLLSSLTFAATIGTTYQIRVGGFFGGSGNFELNVACAGVGVQNDECAGAFVVVDGLNTGLTNANATTSQPWPCAAGGNDVWYSYVATCCGNVTVDTCTAARTFDTALEVFTGGCAGLISVVCNDDSCGLGSSATFYGVTGLTYYIRLGGFGGGTGNCEMNISCTPAAPANDECAGAIPVNTGANGPFNNFCSSTSAPAWPCGAGGSDVWFSYVATCNAPHKIELCGADYDTTVEVFDACNGNSLGCNDDFCGLDSTISVAMTAGNTYFIRVGGFGSGQGNFPLNITPGTGAGTIALTTASQCTGGALSLSVTGNPNIGGSVNSALSGNLGLGFVTWGFAGAPLLAPVCPCIILSVSTDWQFTNSLNLNIPCDGIFIGTPLETQGADLFGVPACGFPVTNAFTDIFTVTIG